MKMKNLTNSDFVAFMRDVITLYNRVSIPALAPFVTALSDRVQEEAAKRFPSVKLWLMPKSTS